MATRKGQGDRGGRRGQAAQRRAANEDAQAARSEPHVTKAPLNTARENLEVSAARAEAALRVSERRFSEAQLLAGIGVWEWNLDTDEAWWSPVVYQLWGLPPAETPPIETLPLNPEDRDSYEQAIAQARSDGELNVEWRVALSDGSVRWLAAIGRMERLEGGRRMLGITQDITRRKQIESRLTLLLGELQHRARNLLGVVRSVVHRTVKTATTVEELAAHLEGRLATLARTQSVLSRDGSATVELEEIVRDEMVAVAVREEQLTIRGPLVRLKREAAETLALALHELTTNAVKYGALSEPAGRLSVSWRVVDAASGKRLSLAWKEDGVRALDTRPSRSGFGRELIEKGLPFELGAETSLEFARGGVRASIELPLTDRVADFPVGEADEPQEREA
jgi:two-component system CheB/CheR fusion protein